MVRSIAQATLLLAAACGPPRWVSREVPALSTAYEFLVRGAAPGALLEVSCASVELPEEVHTARGVAGDPLRVFGLLADHTYACALETPGLVETRTITTPALPDDLPSITVTGETEGYTLFNTAQDEGPRNQTLVVVDDAGRVRWYHQLSENVSDVDASWLPNEGHFLVGGGFSVPPRRRELDGTVSARAAAAVFAPYHHHVEQRADGTVLALRETSVSSDGVSWRGFRVDALEPDLRSVAWSWDSQRGVDEGWLPPRTGERDDVYHANALFDDGQTLFVSLRQIHQIVAVDIESGDRRFVVGRGGDLTLLDASGARLTTEQWFFGQHAPKVDGNRLLVHDNGWNRPTAADEFSRVAVYELDVEQGEARLTWSWTEPGWYEPIWGDADWLPNGHILITRAHCSSCPLTEAGNTQLIQVDPTTNSVVWRLVLDDPLATGYRAQRIDGCDIFANQQMCAEAAELTR